MKRRGCAEGSIHSPRAVWRIQSTATLLLGYRCKGYRLFVAGGTSLRVIVISSHSRLKRVPNKVRYEFWAIHESIALKSTPIPHLTYLYTTESATMHLMYTLDERGNRYVQLSCSLWGISWCSRIYTLKVRSCPRKGVPADNLEIDFRRKGL